MVLMEKRLLGQPGNTMAAEVGEPGVVQHLRTAFRHIATVLALLCMAIVILFVILVFVVIIGVFVQKILGSHTACIEGFFDVKKGVENATKSTKFADKICTFCSIFYTLFYIKKSFYAGCDTIHMELVTSD
jgi:hypothetical protein